jgi:hypothetical protein
MNLVAQNELHSGPTIITLQWLELHHHQLSSFLGE